MSIGAGLTLVTGPTGGGKTCVVVSWLADIKDRPLYAMGIPDLKLEHHPVPPLAEWTELRPSPEDPLIKLPYFTFAPNAIVILDEAQRIYRPRRAGSDVPPYVAAFETRRHTGVDFVLITQHPGLIDSNLRKLVTRHIHIHDTFTGRYLLEWVGMGEPDSRASRTMATRSSFSPPKRAFDLYKSSELHTKIVRKRPWYFWASLILIPFAVVMSYYTYSRIKEKISGTPPIPVSTSSSSLPRGASQPNPVQKNTENKNGKVTLTPAEYLANYQPRLEGLPHTAPAYDEVTQPVEPPEPVGCIDSKSTGCKCYTQQGTRYETTPQLCQQILAGGLFMPWRRSDQPAYKTGSVSPQAPSAPPESGASFSYIPPNMPGELSSYEPLAPKAVTTIRKPSS